MSRIAKALVIVLLAMLPLRGMAAVIAALCDPQHAAQVQTQAAHDCCDGHSTEALGGDDCGDGASHASCSHCAACSINASVAEAPITVALLAPVGALSIPFLDRRPTGFVPESFDRPPTAL